MNDKSRIIATGDDAVRNGSFLYTPACMRGVSEFVNGDYMGTLRGADLLGMAGLRGRKAFDYLDAFVSAQLSDGYREYSWREFKRLVPREIL